VNEHSDLDWLGRNGGWVLLVLGLVLIALSVVIINKREAVASILAFSGVAAFVFGVLLSRLEGAFEFSPTKFAATLKAVRTVGIREDLTLEEKADLIIHLLGVGRDEQEAAEPTYLEAPKVEGSDDQRDYLPARLLSFTAPTEINQVKLAGSSFEQHVAQIFRAERWDVEETRPGPDSGFDFIARKNDKTLYIEVKLRHRLSTADAYQVIGAVHSRNDPPDVRYALAVNAGALSASARAALAADPNIYVMEIPVEGW
jgi:hypothetical protein